MSDVTTLLAENHKQKLILIASNRKTAPKGQNVEHSDSEEKTLSLCLIQPHGNLKRLLRTTPC